LMV
jgi:hypothetical protein